MRNPMPTHTHTWLIHCADVQAGTLTVYCPCGQVGVAERVSPEVLQAAIEVSADRAWWEGPVNPDNPDAL
jgi:hypothetical protein